MTAKPPLQPKPFSDPCFSVILSQWFAWKQGISPTRKPRGYNGQNPDLLAAFAALDRAERRASTPNR